VDFKERKVPEFGFGIVFVEYLPVCLRL
jgi:hypothetical protein